MNEKLHNLLNEQANYELFAAHCYEAAAAWCDEHDYKGSAGFFLKQAEEERQHARRFLKHLADRNVKATLDAIKAPRSNFKNLVDLAGHAVELEHQNTENIIACYETAAELKELRSLPFLLEFISEQVEEEAWTQTLLTICRRNECPGSQFDLDRHIEKVLGS